MSSLNNNGSCLNMVNDGPLASGRTHTEDLTSQVDGSTHIFTTTYSYVALSVSLSGTQFPFIYRKVIDFSESADKEITLDLTQIGIPQSDQTLEVQYIIS